MIGNKIGAGLRFPTLELGVLWPTYGTGPSPQNTISYSGVGQPAQPIADPWKAFQRIFMNVNSGGGGGDDAAALRQKETELVLDSASAEFNAIMPGLGASDKARLQEHLSRLAEIKSSLVAPSSMGPSCLPPTNITAADTISYQTGSGDSHQTVAAAASNRMPTISKQMIDMAVMSLACDVTRTASLHFTRGDDPTFQSEFDGPSPPDEIDDRNFPAFPDDVYPDTAANRYRWRLSVLAAMKALSIDDPFAAVIVFYAHTFFKSDMPTGDS
jgi:hypothetical protein